MNYLKQKPIRSKKITQSAAGEDCTLRIPGVCNFDPSTVVFCHAPSVDSGMRIKSPDWWGAYGCSDCHDVIDGRVKMVTLGFEEVDREELQRHWLPAIYETQKKLIAKDLIKI